jgi:hypothetical protein
VPPVAPTDCSATPVTSSSIRLDWKDRSTDEDGFAIQGQAFTPGGSWSTLPNTILVDTVNAQSYTISDLVQGTRYRFRVHARGQGGLLSTASNWAQATIWVPDGYSLDWRDDFDSFDNGTWSKGLSNSQDAANHVIWNRQTGGPGLLNFQYAGFNLDANVVVEKGALKLYNHREDYVGPDYEARNRNPQSRSCRGQNLPVHEWMGQLA